MSHISTAFTMLNIPDSPRSCTVRALPHAAATDSVTGIAFATWLESVASDEDDADSCPHKEARRVHESIASGEDPSRTR
eukprot:CAMPEP_0171503036 /NCGR_PEP_ID=MMETSP0958-20121227/10604_1 /TAXON_ID=87120 /ORGANISM="Aurantiochytrium limacinum, Strain ATCCMYA-1381" /LENGTH=78 /DNA_ID=CAMNT_0012038345 /DNA_START=231 /DNA_END=468 /DNA_ORIENTATION=-